MRVLACVAWALALVLSTSGYVVGRALYERGATYGVPGPAIPDLDGPPRAINTQLELEPDVEAQRRSLHMIREAGFGWIRQPFQWTNVEGGGKGQFLDTDRNRSTWTDYDQIVQLAREEGLHVIARIDHPPAWARPPGSTATHPPLRAQDYGDFVAAFVEHYRGQIDHIQLWNEPNLNNEWGDEPVDPAAYVELLKAGYQAAKQADPSVRILSGELAQTLEPDAPGAKGLDDLVYLNRMYESGAQPFFDILAVNAYGLWTGPGDRQVGAPYTNFPRVLLARRIMEQHDDAGKAVWVTEFGWNALPAGWQGDPSPWGQVSPQDQARYITGAYDRARQEWPWMGPMALWLFHQPGANPRDPTPYFGLVDEAWHPRPAYDALRQSDPLILGPGIHQEDTAGIGYGRVWEWSFDPGASLGGMRESPIPDATVTVRFEGTRLELLAPVGPTRGIAYAKINGSYTLANRLPLNQFGQATIDEYAPAARSQQHIVIADGLPDRVHELSITVTGEHNPASSGPGVGLDAIVVTRARPVTPLVLLGGAWAATLLALAWTARAPTVAAADGLLWQATQRAPSLVDVAARISWRRASVFAVAAALPLAPVSVRTPAGHYSPVELLLLAGLGIGALELVARGRLSGWRGAFAGPAVLIVVAGVVSLLVADYPRLGLRELRTLILEPVAFYFLARSALRGWRDGLRLAGWFLAGATLASALALVQTVTGHGLVAAEGVRRAAALYPSPNNLALLLDRAAPLAAGLAVVWPSTLRSPLLRARAEPHVQRGFAIAAVVCGFALFFTFSKGAWLATAVALAGLALPWVTALPRQRRRRLAIATIAGGVPVVLLLAAVALRVERFRSVVTSVVRIYLWRASLDMIRDHPIWGVGLDQFLYHYPQYMLPEAWREPNLSHPHNVLLDFWLSLGILGLGALLWGCWTFYRRVRSSRSAVRGAAQSLLRGAAAAGVAMALHGFVDNSYFVQDLAYATWIICLLVELATER